MKPSGTFKNARGDTVHMYVPLISENPPQVAPIMGLILDEIFSGQEYPIPEFMLKVPDQIVVDVGGNIGASAVYFHLCLPDAKIHAYEPQKAAFEYLLKNCSQNSNMTPYNYGLSNEAGTVPIYSVNNEHWAASLNQMSDNNAIEEVEIRKAADEVKKLDHINILKIDTEGHEIPILRDILTVHTPDILFVEYHSEQDRLAIDQLIKDTMILGCTRAIFPNKGTNTYYNKKWL